MTLTDILISQLTDVFRIGLLFFLIVTMRRNVTQTGTIVPLILGTIFVAVLIPSAMSSAASSDTKLAVGVGLISNAVILVILLAGFRVYDHTKKDNS